MTTKIDSHIIWQKFIKIFLLNVPFLIVVVREAFVTYCPLECGLWARPWPWTTLSRSRYPSSLVSLSSSLIWVSPKGSLERPVQPFAASPKGSWRPGPGLELPHQEPQFPHTKKMWTYRILVFGSKFYPPSSWARGPSSWFQGPKPMNKGSRSRKRCKVIIISLLSSSEAGEFMQRNVLGLIWWWISCTVRAA